MNAAYRLVDRERFPSGTSFTVGQVTVGGPQFVIIAGPCSVESGEQILNCAKIAKESGADILRAGCFKPRTSPYSFQGLGLEGLALLKEASQRYSIPFITEVG